MGRPKIVEFTGLEGLESQDSRPAKKKSAAAKAMADKSLNNKQLEVQTISEPDQTAPNQIVTESTTELVTDLVEEASSAVVSNPFDSAQAVRGSEEPSGSRRGEKSPDEIATPSSDTQARDDKKEAAEPVKIQPKVGQAKVRSKRYTSLLSFIEKGKLYPLDEAIETLKKTSAVKFDPTVEIQINLGVDITKSDQLVRTTTTLPHSTGKAPKLLVFSSDAKAMEDKDVTIGDDKTIEQIEKTGKIAADKILATAEWMPKLSKVAKILGPKGLMPNPKTGTVTTDVAKTVADFKGGLLEIRTEAGGPIIHTRIGKLSLDEAKIKENLKALIEAVIKAKPAAVKRNYLKSAYLHVTMGPSIRLDLSSLN